MTTQSAPVVARLLLPDDANPAGNVHGGTILRLMEEAGMITATRYMSSNGHTNGGNCIAALVRFETMSFLKPVFVGDVASLSTRILFTSDHSVLVEVVVSAEDVSKGKTRVTNTGELWYVPLGPGGGDSEKSDWKHPKVVPVPKKIPTDEEELKEYERAKQYYDKRKSIQQNGGDDSLGCLNIDGCLCPACRSKYIPPSEGRSPSESEQVLCQVVLPGDCGKGGVAFGGFIMKLMDNAAGCSAFRHCRTNVVTVAISAMDFVDWINLGDLCTIRSKVTFCSAKSLEIEVVASAASANAIDKDDVVVAKGTFTMVSIGPDGKPLTVPKLRLESEEDMQNAFLGQQRYEAGKRARAEGKVTAK